MVWTGGLMDIRQALTTLEHNPQWVDRYLTFLAETVEPDEAEAEAHHILPKALFPEFRRFREHPWNRIHLSPADHLLAHYYLYRAIPSIRTRFAFRMMVGTRALASIEHTYDEALVREVAETYAAAQRGFHHTPATRAKMSQSQLLEHERRRTAPSPYTFMPRGDSHHRRIFGISDDTKAKISAGLTGKTQPASQVEKRRLKLIGQRKPWSLDARARRSLAMQGVTPTNGFSFTGRKHSQSALDKKSAAMKALYQQDPNHPCFTNKPSGTSHWTYGQPRDESTRSKISASLTGKTASEDTKAKMSETRARKAYDAITPEEHATLEQALSHPNRLSLRTGLKASDRLYVLITGLNTIFEGKATPETIRYWGPADRWLQFTGREHLRPRLL